VSFFPLPLAMIHDRTLRLVLLLTLLLALVIRGAVALLALERRTTEAQDTHTYVQPAESMVAVGRFDSDSAPELSRTPGYPMLIAVGELTGHVVPTILALQVILSTATTLGVAALALAMRGSERVAVLAAIIYALDPTGIIYVSKVLTETTFAAVLTAALIASTLWARDGKRTYLVLAAVAFSIATFVRPIAYYAPVPGAALVAFIAWRYHRASVRSAVLLATLFFGIAAAPLAAWRVRNAIVAGYDRFAGIGDVNLLDWRAAGVVARQSGKPLDEVQLQMRRELDVDAPLISAGRFARGQERAARYREMRRRGTAIIANNPMAVALDWVAAASRTVFGRETTEWATLLGFETLSRPWVVTRAVLTVIWFPVLLLAVVGLLGVRWDPPVVLPGLLVAAYLVILGSGPEAYSRFRVPFVPVICVFAAAGAFHVRQRVIAWSAQRSR
jgi:4-amino-4-deoxy-L-arabinose transferase-like glycosyltransferase